jgi:hypothetical protein
MSESNQSDGKRTNAVGYGRPPVNRQFRPGQSGNPKGRPKDRKNLTTTLAEILQEKVKVSDRNGARKLSKWEAMLQVWVNKALSGDVRALKELIQMMEKLDFFKKQFPEVRFASSKEYLMKELAKIGKLPHNRPNQNDADKKQTE